MENLFGINVFLIMLMHALKSFPLSIFNTMNFSYLNTEKSVYIILKGIPNKIIAKHKVNTYIIFFNA